jgi:pSer/pThr/pTyr-binding forkhead associated (FHA) protein
MPDLTFHILDGIDKGRVFRNLPTPITIGREEGNLLRLNDERVSRFHAKVQHDNGEIILTDLDSTNGTRVNGNTVQIRRLRIGDRISIGRSILLLGSEAEIREQMDVKASNATSVSQSLPDNVPGTVLFNTLAGDLPDNADFDLSLEKLEAGEQPGQVLVGDRVLPPLPQHLTPSQAARLSEVLEFLHRHLLAATENIATQQETAQVVLGFRDWQRIQLVQMLLARYGRAVTEPDVLDE